MMVQGKEEARAGAARARIGIGVAASVSYDSVHRRGGTQGY
jgi:hypothetical protein